MAMQPKLWTASALSVELGVDRRVMAKRLERVTPAEVRGTRKLYRIRDALGTATADTPSVEEARRRKIAAEAALAEYALAELRGEVIRIDVSVAHAERAAVAIRAKVLGLPTKLAPIVATLETPDECKAEIEVACYEVLSELVAGFGSADRLDAGGSGESLEALQPDAGEAS